MSVEGAHHNAAVLLAAEHAVARVLAEAADEASAYPQLLAAIGGSLGWEVGGVWTAGEDGTLRCTATWRGPEPFAEASRSIPLQPGEGLPGRVWASGKSAWIVDLATEPNFPRGPAAVLAGLRAAFCFPIHGSTGLIAAREYLAA